MGAFHAYDIRGVYGVDFNAETAYRVGYFIPRLLKVDKVLVGRDCRVSSEEIRDNLVKGITDAGVDVYDMGLTSTPMVYFGTVRYDFGASVQITASHNSAEYNGMKISRENALPVGLDSGLDKIKGWVESDEPTPAAAEKGKIFSKEFFEDYMEFMMNFKGDYTNLRIAFDLSNGMSNLFAKRVFGDRPVYLSDTIDGRFPDHDPNPLVAKNVEPLKKAVLESKADVGVIYDGDADRVMFVDNEGEFVSPDLVVALMAKYFCDERGAKNPVVLQEIRSSKSVGEYLQNYGADLHTWRVGRAYAAPRLREIDGLWGGELAGHYYFKDFFYSDSGLLSSLIVLRIVSALKERGISLSEQMKSMTGYKNSGEINFRLEDKQGAIAAVRDMYLAEEEPSALMEFDGVRVEFKEWWFNIRPSNTEPYLRFICEATSEELLNEKVKRTEKFLVENFGAVRQ